MAENTIPTGYSAPEAPAAVEEAGELTPAGLSAAVRRFVDGVRDVFTVRTVYGNPIEAHGVTIVPVAQTYFGFGGGGGVGRSPKPEGLDQGIGGGGGGGGVVRPIGFIESTAAGARWVPITRPWQRVTMGVVPPILAILVGRAMGGRKALPAAKER